MRRLLCAIALVVLPLEPSVQHGLLAVLGGGGCTNPTGTLFYDTYGDNNINCGFGGFTGCRNMWIRTGTGTTIITSPGSPAANTACGKSLQNVEGADNGEYVYTAGQFPQIPSATTVDVFVDVYVSSHSFAAFDAKTFFCASVDTSCGAFSASVKWRYDGADFGVIGNGSTASSQANITLSAWHNVQLHVETGAAASYVAVDGGAHQTFTKNAQVTKYFIVGGVTGNAKAVTYAAGDIYANSTLTGQFFGPSMFVDGSGTVNGTVPSNSNTKSATNCLIPNSTYAVTNTIDVWSNTVSQNTLTSKSVCGTAFNGTHATAFRHDLSDNDIITYALTTISTDADAGFWFYDTNVLSDTLQYAVFRLNASPRFAVLELVSNGTQLQADVEYDNNGSTLHGPFINISPNTWYWCAIKYVSGGNPGMELKIYDTSGNIVGTSPSTGAATASPIQSWEFGHVGSLNSAAGVYVYYSNFVVNAISQWSSTYPILP